MFVSLLNTLLGCRPVCEVLGENLTEPSLRVNIGQTLLSDCCKDSDAHVIQEALRRARYEFPSCQKIIISKKWGFTNVDMEERLKLMEDKRVV